MAERVAGIITKRLNDYSFPITDHVFGRPEQLTESRSDVPRAQFRPSSRPASVTVTAGFTTQIK